MPYTTIDNPELYMQTELWTGDQSNNPRTLDGTENMQPDLVWVKGRSFADTGGIFDSVRGATKLLIPSATSAESTVAESLKSFDSDGFTMGTESALNKSSNTMVAWCWKESATAGFDIIEFTGNATARNISHNLSAIPEVIIIKNHSSSSSYWTSYHKPVGNTGELYLNATDAAGGSVAAWNSTTPDASNFRLGANTGVNGSGNTIIAYVFAPVKGFSAMGSYKGSANANGPFIWTGFSPSFVMAKMTSGTGNWNIFDNKRTDSGAVGGNVIDKRIKANATDAEIDGSANRVDFLANGFKWRGTDDDTNVSSGTFIYIAFAESPFVNSKGVPANAR